LDGALEATEDDEPGRLPQSQTWEKDGKGIKKLKHLEIPGDTWSTACRNYQIERLQKFETT
jgi:hypothetical protein